MQMARCKRPGEEWPGANGQVQMHMNEHDQYLSGCRGAQVWLRDMERSAGSDTSRYKPIAWGKLGRYKPITWGRLGRCKPITGHF